MRIASGGFGVAVLRSTLLMTRFCTSTCMRCVMRVGHSRRLLHGAQVFHRCGPSGHPRHQHIRRGYGVLDCQVDSHAADR